VATYVVFDAPFVMFTDTPSNYLAEDETTRFMATIPATFDHTEVVCGKVGDYIVTARRSGEKWFLGGLTSWEGRTIDIPLDFLGEGEWKAELFLDGVNADLTGTDYRTEKRTIKGGDTLSVEMKSGGGFAAIFSR
jgi:alpha-glucosidase